MPKPSSPVPRAWRAAPRCAWRALPRRPRPSRNCPPRRRPSAACACCTAGRRRPRAVAGRTGGAPRAAQGRRAPAVHAARGAAASSRATSTRELQRRARRCAQLAFDTLNHGIVRGLRHDVLPRWSTEVGETCNFTTLDGAQVLYLDRVEAQWPLRLTLDVGSHVPLHCTASGKLFLATMPEAQRDALIARLRLPAHDAPTRSPRPRRCAPNARRSPRGLLDSTARSSSPG